MISFNLKTRYFRNPFELDALIAILLLILVLLIPLAWYIMGKYKTYTFKEQDPNSGSLPSGIGNENPQISSSVNPFTAGLQKAGIGQISSFEQDTTAIPNNPTNFKSLECADGLVPINDVISGATICLADFDSECKTVADCRPEVIGCINNRCSLLSNVNQPCKNNIDCWYFEGKRMNNYSCIKDFGSVTGYCKVDNYPQNAGCNYDSDCNSIGIFNQVSCLKQENSTLIQNYQDSLIEFNISKNNNIVYFSSPDEGVNHNFWTLSTQIVLFDLTDRSQVTENFLTDGYTFGNSFYTGIISGTSSGAFNVIDLIDIEKPTGSLPISQFGSSSGLVSFGGYPNHINAVIAGYVGICVEKLPRGAPSNVKIGNINIPCQDQLVSKGGRCVEPHWSGKLGQLCMNLENNPQDTILRCNESTNENFPYGCAYDYNVTDTALNSFLYNYNPQDYNIYQLGICSIENVNIGNPCSIPYSGCSRPYVCLPALNDSNNITPVCLQPLDIMYCSQGAVCPTNYTCDTVTSSLGVCVPVCKGLTNATCFDFDDCTNGCISNNLYLRMYSTDQNRYIDLATLEGIDISNLGKYKILLSQVYQTVSNFPGFNQGSTVSTKMPSNIALFENNLNHTTPPSSTILTYNLNTSTNSYENNKNFVVRTTDAIDMQAMYTTDSKLAIFTGYTNKTIPEFGYKIYTYNPNDQYVQFNLEGYNIFNNDSSSIYYAYIYSPTLDLDSQENNVFVIIPSTTVETYSDTEIRIFNCITNVLSTDFDTKFSTFKNNNDSNTFYMMISVYSPSTDNLIFNYRNISSVSDELFHIPAVYKFDSNNVNTRQLIYCPLFNTGDQIKTSDGTNYYLEELYLDDTPYSYNFIFNIHNDYFGSEGDVMFSSDNDKIFNMNNSSIDFSSMTFNYNTNTKSYTMNTIDLSNINNNDIVVIPNQQDLAMNKASINGINRSISYVYDKNIDVEISMETNNDKNYIYFKSDITQQNSTYNSISSSTGTSISNVYVQKVEYIESGTSTYNSDYDNIFFSKYELITGETTNYYNYKYTNSLAIPRPKTRPQTDSFVSNFEESFFDNQANTIQFMTTYKNNQRDTDTQIASFSRFNQKEFVQSSGNIGTSYANYNIFESEQYQPYIIESNISLDESSSGNRITNNGMNIVFTDQEVIQTIVSFPSSEIALTNNGSTLESYFINGSGTSTVLYALQQEFPGVQLPNINDINTTQYSSKHTEILRTISVVDYDDDTDELTVKLNAPIDINNAYIQDIFNNGVKPRLWLHNFAPITYLTGEENLIHGINNSGTMNLQINSYDGEYNNFTIMDSSVIFGGTKTNDYDFDFNTNNLNRTSYNKLVYYDGSEYNSYLVRDNYFITIQNGFNTIVDTVKNTTYNSTLSSRLNETIFNSALNNYTEPGSGVVKDKNNVQVFTTNQYTSLNNVFSLNTSNNPFSSMLQLNNYFRNGIVDPLLETIGFNGDSSFDSNNSLLNTITTSSTTLSKHNYLGNNTLGVAVNSNLSGSFFSINSSRVFYNSGLLSNLNSGVTLPSKVRIFEINGSNSSSNISIEYASSYGDIISTSNNFENNRSLISSIQAQNVNLQTAGFEAYNPKETLYTTYNQVNGTNNSFCYFKRKYLRSRLLDSASALTSFGQGDLVSTINNIYEIFPIGNNNAIDNYIRDNIVFASYNLASIPENVSGLTFFSDGSNSYNNSPTIYGNQTPNINIHNRQPVQSFTEGCKTSLPDVQMISNTPLGFTWLSANFEKGGSVSDQYQIINKTYIDKYTDLLLIKYSMNSDLNMFSWRSSIPENDQIISNNYFSKVSSFLTASSGGTNTYEVDLNLHNNAVVIYLETRPPYSGTINIPLNEQMRSNTNLQLYVVNNMFMTSIERPLNSVADDIKSLFKFNNRNLGNNVYIINSFIYNDQTYYRMTGQINFPINTCPTVVGKNSNYNMSNAEVINFPQHFTERFVSSEINNFVIDKLYTSYKFGNDFSKLRYYVYGHYTTELTNVNEGAQVPNYQLLYLSTSSEKSLLTKDRGIPTSISFLESANTLNIDNAIVYEPFNNLLIMLSSKCV